MPWITVGANDRQADYNAAITAISQVTAPYYGIVLRYPAPFELVTFGTEKDAAAWYREAIKAPDAEFVAYYQTGIKQPFNFHKAGAYVNDLSLAPRQRAENGRGAVGKLGLAALLGLIAGRIFFGGKKK